MIFNNISLYSKYEYLKDIIDKCFLYLKENDFTSIEDGSYQICNKARAIVQRYKCKDLKDCRFEAHDKHIDIQFIAKGQECIGIYNRDKCIVDEDKLLTQDVVFFKDIKGANFINLNAGDFLLITPDEAHMPQIKIGTNDEVIKVVVKIEI